MNKDCKTLCATIIAAHLLTMPTFANDAINVTLSVPSVIFLGEALPVSVRIHNASDEIRDILTPAIRRFGRDRITFSLQKPGTNGFVHIDHPDVYVGGMKMISPAPYPIQQLAGGGTLECHFILVYDFPDEDCRERLFPTPGRYMLRASVFEPLDSQDHAMSVPYDSRWHAIQSEMETVVVSIPDGVRDQQALKAFETLPCEYLLYAPFSFRFDCHKDALEPLKVFLLEYLDTDLGRRAALPLGVAMSQGLVQDERHAIVDTLGLLGKGANAELRDTALAIEARLNH